MAEDTGSSMATLLDQLRKANGESANRRAKIKALQAQLDERAREFDALRAEMATHADAVKAAEADRDQWKTKFESAPNEWRTKYDEAAGKLKTRDHEDAFKGLYDDEELGLNPAVPVAKLWNILGYKPEADAVDPAAIKALVAGARETDPYLFAPKAVKADDAGGPAPKPTEPPTLPPGPNASRGAAGHEAGAMTVTRAQRRDPEWMRQNQPAIAKAAKEGRLVSIESSF